MVVDCSRASKKVTFGADEYVWHPSGPARLCRAEWTTEAGKLRMEVRAESEIAKGVADGVNGPNERELTGAALQGA
jgi:hypothetical protein